MCHFGVPGRGGNNSLFGVFFAVGPKVYPGSVLESLMGVPGCFFIDFGLDLCPFGCPQVPSRTVSWWIWDCFACNLLRLG